MTPPIHPHVFLGGTCGKLPGWRHKIAMPALDAAGITYYNPQYPEGSWHDGLIEIEAIAKNNATQLLIVIEGSTRATTSILEAVEYVCYGSFVHLVIEDMIPGTVIMGHAVIGRELEDVNRGRAYLRSVVRRRRPHLPIHPNIITAVGKTILIAQAYQ